MARDANFMFGKKIIFFHSHSKLYYVTNIFNYGAVEIQSLETKKKDQSECETFGETLIAMDKKENVKEFVRLVELSEQPIKPNKKELEISKVGTNKNVREFKMAGPDLYQKINSHVQLNKKKSNYSLPNIKKKVKINHQQ